MSYQSASQNHSVQIAVIGGSGFYQLNSLSHPRRESHSTTYGEAQIELGRVGEKAVGFMLRHGGGHKLPPHKVNYRANIRALKDLGVEKIIAINAVGGIGDNFLHTKIL